MHPPIVQGLQKPEKLQSLHPLTFSHPVGKVILHIKPTIETTIETAQDITFGMWVVIQKSEVVCQEQFLLFLFFLIFFYVWGWCWLQTFLWDKGHGGFPVKGKQEKNISLKD